MKLIKRLQKAKNYSSLLELREELRTEISQIKTDVKGDSKLDKIQNYNFYIDRINARIVDCEIKGTIQFEDGNQPNDSDNELTIEDLDLTRQWFNCAQDINEGCLELNDYLLAKRIYEKVGMRVPNGITDAIIRYKK